MQDNHALLEKECPLAEEQIEQYYRDGYLVVPQLVPASTIDQVLKHVRAPEGMKEGGIWSNVEFHFDRPTEDLELHRLLTEPSVIGAVEQIFEGPARVLYAMLAVVPAGGRGLPWHQDNQYAKLLGNAVNVFIACCDIVPEKAILWMAPKSHLLGTQPSKDPGGEYNGHRTAVVEPENGIQLSTLRKGDAVLWDFCTYHRSLRNETSDHRYAYSAQYKADVTRDSATGKKNPKHMLAWDLHNQLRPLMSDK